MRDRDQAIAVNHFAAEIRSLVDELVTTPLSDGREWGLKLDGIVGQCGAMRSLILRAIVDELDARRENPRAGIPPVEVGSWGRADQTAGLDARK